MKNIVTVEFRTENEAKEALAQLKNEQETYGYKILQMGLVKKENGVDTPIEGFDLKEGAANAGIGGVGGGVIGGIIGILGGPVGIAIGIGAGAGVGVGAGKTTAKKLKLKNMGLMQHAISKMPENAVVLIALIEEEEEIVFDNRLKKYKYRTKITHYDVEELAKEIEEAERLAKEAKENEAKRPGENMKKMEELAQENKRLKKEEEKAKKEEEKAKKKAEKAEKAEASDETAAADEETDDAQ